MHFPSLGALSRAALLLGEAECPQGQQDPAGISDRMVRHTAATHTRPSVSTCLECSDIRRVRMTS